jgi:hypothetical protein
MSAKRGGAVKALRLHDARLCLTVAPDDRGDSR